MKYLRITNPGEVDEKAFTLLGASTKRNQNGKIGMFGSGNKYALAYFLRNDYKIKIHAGEEEIKVGKNETIFGGMPFNIMTINGKETSITDQSGPDWVLWHAIREIYSNALDEGEAGFDVVDGIRPKKGETQIHIELKPEVLKFIDNLVFYFAFDRTFVFKSTSGRILEKLGSSLNLYRKGIRCFDTEKNSIFDYDFHDITINESRVMLYESKGCSAAWQLICQCDSVHIIRTFLSRIGENVWENNEYLNYWTEYQSDLSLAWDEAVKGRFFAPSDIGGLVDEKIYEKTYFVPNALYKVIMNKYGREHSAVAFKDGEVPYQEIEQDEFIKNTIDRVSEFFGECSYKMILPMEAVRFIHSKVSDWNKKFVHVDNMKILIDLSHFEEGLNRVAQSYLKGVSIYKADENKQSEGHEFAKDFILYMKKKNSINL